MKRRTVVQLVAAMLASPGWVLAQTSRRFRLGLLLAGNETTARSIVQALLAGLREFVVNLKTARHIGITIPPSRLVRADRVIE